MVWTWEVETDGWTFFYMHLIFKWLSLLVGLVLFGFFFHPYSPQINDYDYDLDQDYCLVNGPKREYLRNRIDRTTNIKNYYIETFFLKVHSWWNWHPPSCNLWSTGGPQTIYVGIHISDVTLGTQKSFFLMITTR